MVNIKKQQSEDLFFVQVKEPSEIRRNILETLRDIVGILQKFEKFKYIRHQKLEKINHLRVQLNHANKMMGNLRLKLPQTNLKAAIVRETSKMPKKPVYKKSKEKSEEKEKLQKKVPTELERLESELNAIESKLKSLT